MKKILQKLLKKNIQYNFLSLLSVFFGFLFTTLLAKKFGANETTDAFFLSIVVINYLGYFVQAIWEAMSPYYSDLKVKDKDSSNKLYLYLLNNIVLSSFIILIFYFILICCFDLVPQYIQSFLNVLIFYFVLKNIIMFNKVILNLEQFFASYYIVDVIIYLVLFFVIFNIEDQELIKISYAFLFGGFLGLSLQFYLLSKQLKLYLYWGFYHPEMKEILWNSSKIKIGLILYDSKDIFITTVFMSIEEGLFSLYNYAKKFAEVIFEVVNAPIINIFVSNSNRWVSQLEFNKVIAAIPKVLSQTLSFFVLTSIMVYLFIPIIFSLLLNDSFSDNEIYQIQSIYAVLICFYLVIAVESPYARLVMILKMFNYGLLINMTFFVMVTIGFLFLNYFGNNYIEFLIVLIIAQLGNLMLAYWGVNKLIKSKV